MVSTPIDLTPKDVERRIRHEWEVWNSGDPDAIAANYSAPWGFGFRTREPRVPLPTKEAYRHSVEQWQNTLDYYRIELDELHTTADGDVGIAWGYYHEEFQPKGGTPQVHHGRFSEVFKKDANGWRSLFYHREATPFDKNGRYVPPK